MVISINYYAIMMTQKMAMMTYFMTWTSHDTKHNLTHHTTRLLFFHDMTSHGSYKNRSRKNNRPEDGDDHTDDRPYDVAIDVELRGSAAQQRGADGLLCESVCECV